MMEQPIIADNTCLLNALSNLTRYIILNIKPFTLIDHNLMIRPT